MEGMLYICLCFILDYVILSMHELQLGQEVQKVAKREVLAYVFLGEDCLDTLVLGETAPNV